MTPPGLTMPPDKDPISCCFASILSLSVYIYLFEKLAESSDPLWTLDFSLIKDFYFWIIVYNLWFFWSNYV